MKLAVYTKAGQVGLADIDRPQIIEEDDAIIQIIEEHCAAGGTLDDINQALVQTVFATGVFTRGKNDEAAAEDVMAKKK